MTVTVILVPPVEAEVWSQAQALEHSVDCWEDRDWSLWPGHQGSIRGQDSGHGPLFITLVLCIFTFLLFSFKI